MVEIACLDSLGNVITGLTQWDVNQTIYFHGLNPDENNPPLIHFCNIKNDRAHACESTVSDGVISVTIPNELLAQALLIYVYIYDYDWDTKIGKTIYISKIPVCAKIRPNDYVFEENVSGVNLVKLDSNVRYLLERDEQLTRDVSTLYDKTALLDSNLSATYTKLDESVTTLKNADLDLDNKIDTNVQRIDGEIEALQEKDNSIDFAINSLEERAFSLENRVAITEGDIGILNGDEEGSINYKIAVAKEEVMSTAATDATNKANAVDEKLTDEIERATAAETVNKALAEAAQVSADKAQEDVDDLIEYVDTTFVNTDNFNTYMTLYSTTEQSDAAYAIKESEHTHENKDVLDSITDEKINAWDEASSTGTSALITSVFNAIYPVGSIYMATTDTDPSNLFGGTWEQIKDTFLLASGDTYTAGSVGGESEHTLTQSELPDHTHLLAVEGTDGIHTLEAWTAVFNQGVFNSSSTSIENVPCGISGGICVENDSSIGEAHNNMPPYLAVYVWKRLTLAA